MGVPQRAIDAAENESGGGHRRDRGWKGTPIKFEDHDQAVGCDREANRQT
jgi:hypothetical protein